MKTPFNFMSTTGIVCISEKGVAALPSYSLLKSVWIESCTRRYIAKRGLSQGMYQLKIEQKGTKCVISPFKIL